MTFLVDKNVINVADLTVGWIIDILLIEVRHGCASGQCSEDFGRPRGHRCRLLRPGRYTNPHCEYGCRDDLSHDLFSPQGLDVRRGVIARLSHALLSDGIK